MFASLTVALLVGNQVGQQDRKISEVSQRVNKVFETVVLPKDRERKNLVDLREVIADACKPAFDDVDWEAVAKVPSRGWIDLVSRSCQWDKVIVLLDSAERDKVPGGLKSQYGQMRLQANVRLGRIEPSVAGYFSLERTNDHEELSLTTEFTEPIARMILKSDGMPACQEFLAKARSRIPVKPKDPFYEWAFGNIRTLPHRVSARLYAEEGAKAQALASLDKALAERDVDSFILRDVKAERRQAQLIGLPAPRLRVILNHEAPKDMAALKGKPVILEFSGGAYFDQELVRAKPFLDRYAPLKAKVGLVRCYWKQGDAAGLLDLDGKSEFALLSAGYAGPRWFVGRKDVLTFGLNSPGAVLIGADGKVVTYLTVYEPASFERFMAAVEKSAS